MAEEKGIYASKLYIRVKDLEKIISDPELSLKLWNSPSVLKKTDRENFNGIQFVKDPSKTDDTLISFSRAILMAREVTNYKKAALKGRRSIANYLIKNEKGKYIEENKEGKTSYKNSKGTIVDLNPYRKKAKNSSEKEEGEGPNQKGQTKTSSNNIGNLTQRGSNTKQSEKKAQQSGRGNAKVKSEFRRNTGQSNAAARKFQPSNKTGNSQKTPTRKNVIQANIAKSNLKRVDKNSGGEQRSQSNKQESKNGRNNSNNNNTNNTNGNKNQNGENSSVCRIINSKNSKDIEKKLQKDVKNYFDKKEKELYEKLDAKKIVEGFVKHLKGKNIDECRVYALLIIALENLEKRIRGRNLFVKPDSKISILHGAKIGRASKHIDYNPNTSKLSIRNLTDKELKMLKISKELRAKIKKLRKNCIDRKQKSIKQANSIKQGKN